MSNDSNKQRDDFITRDQVRDAIALLSKFEVQLDNINEICSDTPLNRHKTPQQKKRKDFISKDDLAKSLLSFLGNFLILIFGLIAAWAIIDPNYLRERKAASPVLSVEYAYFEEIGSVGREPIATMIRQLVQFEKYGEFVLKSMGRHDLRHIDGMSAEIGAGDVGKLASIASMYREFLAEQKKGLSQKESNIPAMQLSELRIHGRATLESINDLNNEELSEKLIEKIRTDQKNIDNVMIALESLDRMLTQIENRVFVKLSILNTGGRPGLVRPRGFIEYADKCYAMRRVEAPPQNRRGIAVPTYVVNSEVGGVAQTVGKIDSDTMAEYWYEILGAANEGSSCSELKEEASVAKSSERQTCPDRNEAIVYLFGHNNREPISQNVVCNGPTS